VLAIGFCFQWRGDKEDHRMEMWWCLIALKPMCRFFFVWCVCVADGRRMIVWQGSCQVKCIGGNLDKQ
jgi:hypothetical protein